MVNYLHPPTHPDNKKKSDFKKADYQLKIEDSNFVHQNRTIFQKRINWTPRECKHIPSGDKISIDI